MSRPSGSGGRVTSIHITPIGGSPMRSVQRVEAVPGGGLVGDRYFRSDGRFSGHSRKNGEVTLIELESIEALLRELRVELDPGAARRNLVTRGVPLNHLVGREFQVGEVTLLGHSLCEPCFHLESLTRPGVLAGLVHRGGLRAQLVTPGSIQVGDSITAPEA